LHKLFAERSTHLKLNRFRKRPATPIIVVHLQESTLSGLPFAQPEGSGAKQRSVCLALNDREFAERKRFRHTYHGRRGLNGDGLAVRSGASRRCCGFGQGGGDRGSGGG